jgi:N-acetylglucosamine malate deacetylase 1
MKLHILAFGVHPDDVELGCAGTILAEISKGKQVGVVDLTQGELGTRGTKEARKQEADAASKILGIAVRENLLMADGFFQNDESHIRKVITIIRKYQPDIVLCNAPEDRHPDHGRSAKLVADAAFLSGLRKIETTYEGQTQVEWRPKNVFHYLQDRYLKPDFVYDVSDFFEKKMEAVLCYSTQFHAANNQSDEPQTYISSPEFLDTVKARALSLGKRIGVKYAEGYISNKTLGISDFNALIHEAT